MEEIKSFAFSDETRKIINENFKEIQNRTTSLQELSTHNENISLLWSYRVDENGKDASDYSLFEGDKRGQQGSGNYPGYETDTFWAFKGLSNNLITGTLCFVQYGLFKIYSDNKLRRPLRTISSSIGGIGIHQRADSYYTNNKTVCCFETENSKYVCYFNTDYCLDNNCLYFKNEYDSNFSNYASIDVLKINSNQTYSLYKDQQIGKNLAGSSYTIYPIAIYICGWNDRVTSSNNTPIGLKNLLINSKFYEELFGIEDINNLGRQIADSFGVSVQLSIDENGQYSVDVQEVSAKNDKRPSRVVLQFTEPLENKITDFWFDTFVEPKKGDLIKMNMGNYADPKKIYRVLKKDLAGNFLLLSMENVYSRSFNDYSRLVTLEDGKVMQKYAKDEYEYSVDYYLTEQHPDSVVDKYKNAIAAVQLEQDGWFLSPFSSEEIIYTGTEEYEGEWSSYTLEREEDIEGEESHYKVPVGERKFFLLGIEDIIEYLGVTPEMDEFNTTLTNNNLIQMFYLEGASNPKNILLKSGRFTDGGGTDKQEHTFIIEKDTGFIKSQLFNISNCEVRPAFYINLREVEWEYA